MTPWYGAIWWTVVTAAGQLAAALVAAWAALEAKKSADSARDAVEAANRSADIAETSMRLNDRAYIALMELKPTYEFEVDRVPSIRLNLKNVGTTPGLKARVSVGVALVNKNETFTEQQIPDLIAANQENYLFAPTLGVNITHQLEMPFEVEHIQMIESDAASLFAWGVITYLDVFGTEHVTKWCFRNMPRSKTQMHLANFHNDMT